MKTKAKPTVKKGLKIAPKKTASVKTTPLRKIQGAKPAGLNPQQDALDEQACINEYNAFVAQLQQKYGRILTPKITLLFLKKS